MIFVALQTFRLNKNKMINISDSARDRLLHLLDTDAVKKQFVRVGVESGGIWSLKRGDS